MFYHLPRDVLFLIFSLLEADQLVFLRRTCLDLLKLIDLYALSQKPKIKFIRGFRLENLASVVEIFYKNCRKFYPKIKFTEMETLDELLGKIKNICELEKQRFFKSKTLLNFFEPYIGSFKEYQLKISSILSKLEIAHKKIYLDGIFKESDSMIFNFVESIYMERKIEIVFKHDYRIKYFFKMALINPLAREILIKFCNYHANQAKTSIPKIVNAIYGEDIKWYDLTSLFIVRRACRYTDKDNYCRFYLQPNLYSELRYSIEENNPFACRHFKQLYELRFLKEVLEDQYAPLLAKIKTDIMSDPRFDHEDESLKKVLDEIERIAIMCDTYPNDDHFVKPEAYKIDDTDKDDISEKLSRYWS